jgi:tetratricopeptide (TPR) repeat protein
VISKNFLKFFLFFLIASAPVQFAAAQETVELAKEEQEEIRSRVISQMKFYSDLMNIVVKKGIDPDEVQDFITTAFSPEQPLFYDSLTILEDDFYAIRADTLPAKDVSVGKYINDLFLFYSKSVDDNSISLYDYRFSRFGRKKYLYVNLFFQVRYRERHKDFSESYPVRKRIATFRIEKKGTDWMPSITGIYFYREKRPDGSIISPEEFELEYKPYVKERRVIHSTTENVLDTLSFDEKQRELLRKADSSYHEALNNQRLALDGERKKEEAYYLSIQKGDSLSAAGLFREAAEYYSDARSLKPFDFTARDKVREMMNLLDGSTEAPEEKLRKQKEFADLKYRIRDFEEALEAYRMVIKLSPEDGSAKERIAELEGILRKWSEIRAMYMDGSSKRASKAFSAEASSGKENPVFYFERARFHLHENERKKGISDLNKAISLHPGFRDALLLRADYYLREGNPASAVADYSSLISIEPGNASNHELKAQAHLAARDAEAAEKEYNLALKIEPDNPQYLSARAALFRQRKSYQDALASAEKALSLKPNFPSAHFQKGLTLLELGEEKAAGMSIQKARKLGLNQLQTAELDKIAGEYEKKAAQVEVAESTEAAISLLKKSLVFKPNSPPTCLRMAELYEKVGKPQDAVKAVDQAIFLREDLIPAYLLKGRIQVNSGEIESSLLTFNKVRKYDSKNLEAAMGLGKAFIRLQKYDSALVWFASVLSLRPDHPEALLNRGICHYKKENYVRASQDFELALREDSKLSEAYFFKGKVHKAYNRFVAAIEDFEKAARLGFNVFECHIEAGNGYEKLGKGAKAIEYYTKAIALNPEKAEAYLMRGMCRLKDEDINNAMADLDEGLKIDTSLSRGPYRTELGFIHLEFEDFERAEKCFTRALEFDRYQPRANFGMGICQFQKGEVSQAMRSFEQGFIPKKLDYAFIKKMPGIKKVLKNKEFKVLEDKYLN